MDDGTTSKGMTERYSSGYATSGLIFIYGNSGLSDGQAGNLYSLDSDGFTIAWTKYGNGCGTITVNYIAVKTGTGPQGSSGYSGYSGYSPTASGVWSTTSNLNTAKQGLAGAGRNIS